MNDVPVGEAFGGCLRPVGTGARGRGSPRLLPAIVLLIAVVSGCDGELDTTYGTVRGPSINGVSAFVHLLRDTGHVVIARQRLPAEIDADVATLVVFDESFTGLSAAAAETLTAFVLGDEPRTLLLILRDSDCTIDYLRDLVARDGLTADRRRQAATMLAVVEEALRTATSVPRGASHPCRDGLEVVDGRAVSASTEVMIRSPDDVTERRIAARWQLQRRLERAADAEPLWEAGQDPLLVRRRLGESTILVLASASPLVNGGLVDPGNRILAEEIANLLPTEGRLLVAASPPGGGARDGGRSGVTEDEGDRDEPSPWRLLTVQPLPWVTAQAIAAMALFCWCTAPIFGRPRRSSPVHAQDFGHHVAALANLFDKSPAGAAFARERLAAWQPATVSSVNTPPRRSPP